MKLVPAALLAGALAVAAAPAAAQTHLNEISIFGSWQDVDEPTDVEVTIVNLRYGRFMSPQMVATGSLARSRFKGLGTDNVSTTFLIGAKYYVNPPRAQGLAPFLDVAIGFANTDAGGGDSTDIAWELGGGAAYFLTERTSVDAALRFYHTDTDIRSQGVRLFLGLTTRF